MSNKTPDQVLTRIRLTEKTAFLAEARNVYTFEVPLCATKTDIKKAVEEGFGVRVEKVNTLTRVGQPRRYRQHHGYTQERKRALVKLHADDRISLY
ncbi:50S ribosomal protein L23 [bacterium]|nr:50S ribosomal protein L23 [bacterium]